MFLTLTRNFGKVMVSSFEAPPINTGKKLEDIVESSFFSSSLIRIVSLFECVNF